MVVNDPSSTFQLNSGRRGEEGVAATLSVGRRGKYARQQHCSTAPGGGCRPSSPLPGRGASNSFTVMNVSPMPPRECLSPPLVSGSRVNTSSQHHIISSNGSRGKRGNGLAADGGYPALEPQSESQPLAAKCPATCQAINVKAHAAAQKLRGSSEARGGGRGGERITGGGPRGESRLSAPRRLSPF